MGNTIHRLINGDARYLSFLPDESVHLVITSPPYWNLKRYNENPNQLGHIEDYESFLNAIKIVWEHVFRILVPGGRLVCVVGDVCVSRRNFGRHLVFPLHADICVLCRKIGFDNLNPIIWHKIANASYEVSNGSKFLGKPYEPNAIVKNDIEFILMQRKPGGYRKPTERQRKESMIDKADFGRWFQQIWNIPGASLKNHPAPYPFELADRLIKMFSFVEDTILDPFCGSGTSMVAALKSHRNSIGIEIDPDYCRMAARYIEAESRDLFNMVELKFEKLIQTEKELYVKEEMALSVAVEEEVGGGVVDTVTDDVLEWTADQLASAILGAKAEADMPRLREMILAAENTGFTIAQSEKLSPWLLSFATKYRDKNNPQDKAAIWSAIRTGASMLTPSYADRLLPLLEPGHSIETSLVTVKMIGRIFEAQPPAEVDEYPVLADEVLRIAEALLNRYAITVSQSAAMAQLAVYALVAMASSKTQQIVESVRQLGVSWFIQQTQRELRELRDIWASRPVPVAERPLELLNRAIESLA